MVKTGSPTSDPTRRAHAGHPGGQRAGRLRARAGTCPRRSVAPLDRREPEGREPDRPADAEPLAGVAAVTADPNPARTPRRESTSPSPAWRRFVRPPRRRCASRSRLDASGAAVRSLLLGVQLQIAATRAPLRRRPSRRSSPTCSATPERWGKTLRTLPWLRATLVVRRSTARRRRQARRRVHVQLRGLRGAVPRRPARRRRAAGAAAGAAPSSTPAPTNRHAGPAASAWDRETGLPAAGTRRGARRSTSTSRTPPGCGWSRSQALREVQVDRRAPRRRPGIR